MSQNRLEHDEQRFATPTIEREVAGPRQQAGLLLWAPRSEELLWDLEREVASARREWVEERQAWWIAASYYETIVALVLRTFPSVLVLGTDEDRLLSRDGYEALQGRLL
ncbi:MAG: hypothetical protein WD737_11980 [Gemmatimonadota bacterium]